MYDLVYICYMMFNLEIQIISLNIFEYFGSFSVFKYVFILTCLNAQNWVVYGF